MNSEPTLGSEGTQPVAPASASQCVVCNAPISGRVYRIGDRSYCAEHYAYVMRPRGTWPAVWLLFIAADRGRATGAAGRTRRLRRC